ncbi:hypothetical protein [Bacteroides eggerthii]|uniref:hypothetical protein n=1 Tax=Bacteroides eggerthii TaxID=28111 RepID=UPI0022E022C7|nr:hypothetical protein [Bacteroides eggerthii]
MIRAFIIGGRVYEMQSPSIKNIILACDILGELPQEGTLEQIFNSKDKETLSQMLSVLTKGDLSISKELFKGSNNELVEVLQTLYEDILLSFKRLSALSNNISRLTANPK